MVKVKEIRVVVNEEILKRMEFLREYYAMNNNAEVIRFLISEKFHEVEKFKTESNIK